MKKNTKIRIAVFFLELLCLAILIGGLYIYRRATVSLQKIEQPEFHEEEITVNAEAPQMKGFSTYAIFGTDHRVLNSEMEGENSDTIIIACVNNSTKEVRLASVYRDTLLDIGDTYAKANAAFAYGGPEQAISMLNTNLDLNIRDFVAVDFSAVTKLVDCFGGLDIPMSYAEIVHMNNYCVETSEETGEDYEPVELPEKAPDDQEKIIGTYHLNGVQVTSYCRIRYTSSLDMGRTERQRFVIGLLVDEAKAAGLTRLFDIMDEVFPLVQTSLSKTEILQLIPAMIGYSLAGNTGFPETYDFAELSDMGSIVVPRDLTTNVSTLHKFLFSEPDYTPTSDVEEKSWEIQNIAETRASSTSSPAPSATYPEAERYDAEYQEPEYDITGEFYEEPDFEEDLFE